MFHFYLPKPLRRFIQLPVYGFYAAKTHLREPFQYVFILGHI